MLGADDGNERAPTDGVVVFESMGEVGADDVGEHGDGGDESSRPRVGRGRVHAQGVDRRVVRRKAS